MNGLFVSPESLSAGGPHFTVADFNVDHVERAWRWSIKHVAGRRIKGTLVTGTLQPFLLTFVIDRTREVRALLPVSVKFTRFRTNQNCRIFLSRIVEVECRVKSKTCGPLDSSRRQTRGLASIQRGLRRETGRSQKEPRRSQSQK